MGGVVRLREFVRSRPQLRKFSLWCRFAPGAELRRRRTLRREGDEWTDELRQAFDIAQSGVYKLDCQIDNLFQSQQGRNFLGYPPMSGIRLDGSEIGWQFGQDVSSGSLTLPSFQVTTDLEVNLPLVFETYLPRLVVDFGTASGASSVLFAKLMGEYAGNGRVLTVDLNDPMKGPHGKSFERALDNLPITSHVGDALASETKEVVKAFLESRQEEVALLSFDDDHSAGHVLRELETYSSLLRPRDVIVVQDTWDQGFRDTPLTALLGVLRFLKENTFFELDVGLLRRVALPCSFVHGVIVMKGTGSHDSGRILPGGRETLS